MRSSVSCKRGAKQRIQKQRLAVDEFHWVGKYPMIMVRGELRHGKPTEIEGNRHILEV